MVTDPVNVNEFSSADFKEFLASFDHVFSDCDGVIWTPGDSLPGSGEFFKKIKEHGKNVHYVSNNSLRTKQNYEDKFRAAGIENGFDNLTIPSTAIAEYLKSVKFSTSKKIFCIACRETIRILESNGFKCCSGPEDVPEQYQDFIQFFEDDLEVGAVVIDSDFRVNLPKLCKAITYLKRDEVIFINGATDKYVPYKRGCVALGTGALTDLVGEESQRMPIQLGKPGKTFGEFAMKRSGVTDPSRVLFIGDMIEQDVGLGKATGFTTLLILTSNTKEDMLAHPTLRPDYYAESLGSIVPLL